LNHNFLVSIDIEAIKDIAIVAGTAVMQIYQTDFTIEYKADDSPLTQADKKANSIICDSLQRLYPLVPILSEENQEVPYSIRKAWEYYWCIDPIDGTKEFIKKNGEFTINIALIYHETPVLGVVYAPALGEIFWAKKNEGAYKNGIKLPFLTNTSPAKKLCVVVSKSHLSAETQAFIDALPSEKIERISTGSSLKLCMVAEGTADVYPRLAPTMEWDTAAADAIVRESGKIVYQYKSNNLLEYNKEKLVNPWFVVVEKL